MGKSVRRSGEQCVIARCSSHQNASALWSKRHTTHLTTHIHTPHRHLGGIFNKIAMRQQQAWSDLRSLLLIMATSITHAFLLPHPTTPSTHPSTALDAPSLVLSPLFLHSSLSAAPPTGPRVLPPLHASTLEAPPSPSPPPTRRPPQRNFEAWTWRGHRINYRVEGDEKVQVAEGWKREGGIRQRTEEGGEEGWC